MVCLFPTSALFTVRRGVVVIHENGKNPLKIRFTENGSKLAQLLTHTHTHTHTHARCIFAHVSLVVSSYWHSYCTIAPDFYTSQQHSRS